MPALVPLRVTAPVRFTMGLFRKTPGLSSLLLPVMVSGPLPVRLPEQLQSSRTPPPPAETDKFDFAPPTAVPPAAVKSVAPAMLTP